jgi:hypothetical protein
VFFVEIVLLNPQRKTQRKPKVEQHDLNEKHYTQRKPKVEQHDLNEKHYTQRIPKVDVYIDFTYIW